jgi:tRNA (mo5U34)-methyltransferase
MQDLEALRRAVAEIKWYHQIDLGHGIITPGVDDTSKKLARLALPERLDGKTVLDIGAWDGFFSFEAEKRGAKRVLATDSYVWNGATWGSKNGFLLARKALKSSVEDKHLDILDMTPEEIGTFDVVLFAGVLYHMKHPLLALEKLASVTRGMAVIETVCGFIWCRQPVIPFYPNDELNGDPSNWCAPNPAATVALLKTAGFREVKIVADVRSIFFRLAKAAYYKAKWGRPFWSLVRTDRMVVHAYK